MTTSQPDRAAKEAADYARREKIVADWLLTQPDKERRRLERMDLSEQEAAMAWATWEMSPDDRKKLKNLGIDRSSRNSHKVSGHSPHEEDDAANHPNARTETLTIEGTMEDRLMESFDLATGQARGIAALIKSECSRAEERATASMLPKLVGPILREQNVKISMLGLAYAVGMDALNGLGSIRDCATANGVSPEAISKKKRQWQKELNLPVNAHGKKKEACEALSKAQMKGHWRNKKA